tara:strand:- start:2341 stop:2682 length:342 start_codon:yes stop_codon:yes gene_type:complete
MKTTIKNFFERLIQPLSRFWDKPYSVRYVEDPVDHPKKKTLYIIGTEKEPWQVELICPCGCKDKIVLPVNDSTSPRWRLKTTNQGVPTLSPSIWRSKRCRSHFFLQNGKINWC